MDNDPLNDIRHIELKRRLIQEIYDKGDEYRDDIVPASQEEIDKIEAEWDALPEEKKREYIDYDKAAFKARFMDIIISAQNARRITQSIDEMLDESEDDK